MFLTATALAQTFDGSCSVFTWLCGIAKRHLAHFQRRESRQKRIPPGQILSLDEETLQFYQEWEVGVSPEEEAIHRMEAARLVEAMMAALREEEREVLMLRYVHEFSLREIAGVTTLWDSTFRISSKSAPGIRGQQLAFPAEFPQLGKGFPAPRGKTNKETRTHAEKGAKGLAQYLRVLKVFLLVGIGGVGGWADYCPPSSPQSDGMRDIMLIYGGKGLWKPADFLPYVAYLDRQGRPKDWFYDAFLFLMYGGAPSGQTYIDGATNRADWEFFLDELFAPERELVALEATVEAVAEDLGRPGPTVPVLVMIPYPSRQQKDFGDVEGNGTHENLNSPSARRKVVAWFLRNFLDRWQQQSYRHLKLWGFYWMNEGISGEDEEIVQATAQEIHRLGYKFHWIPWFNAPGVEKWRELGFDLVIMQPNYAFMPPTGGLRIPDENRLTVAANQCRRLGMGIEMELNEGLFTDPAYRFNLRRYLDHGESRLDGYQLGAVRAYYQGTDTIARLGRSSDPALRRFYDDLFRFHQGTYRPGWPYQPLPIPRKEGAAGQPLPCLVDGRWNTWPGTKAKTVELTDPRAAFTWVWKSQRWVGDVRVHFSFPDQESLARPGRVSLSLSPEVQGPVWEEVAALDLLSTFPEKGGGFGIFTFPLRPARRMRLTVHLPPGQHLAMDEVLLMPAAHLLWGVPSQVSAGAQDVGSVLTDGITGGKDQVRWPQGTGQVRWDLAETWYAESLGVHFRRVHKARFFPRLRVQVTPLSTPGSSPGARPLWVQAQVTGDEAWAMVPLHQAIPGLVVTFEDRAAGAVAVDEVALLPIPNLALGCPYTFDPPLEAQYPDSGSQELTDGQVTTQGFGDGKTVGWASWSGAAVVTVVVDTGQVRPLDTVEVHLEGGGYAAVHFPSRTAVAVSDEGIDWSPVEVSEILPPEVESRMVEGLRCDLGWLKLPLGRAQGRFVKLLFWPNGWLMLSEIHILSEGQNVALNQPYFLQPPPTGEGKYPDNVGKMTDGLYSHPADRWQACVGFEQADPTLTVDLRIPRRIQAARIHLVGGGRGGVWFPEEVHISTSLDGQDWAFAGVTKDHPPEKGNEVVVGFMGVSLPPRKARWVRFHLKRRGWTMPDEVEVIPAR